MGNTIFDRQDNWRGIKAVIPGKLVQEGYSDNTTGKTVLYTVPTGNTLYISHYFAACGNPSTGNYSTIGVYNTSDIPICILSDASLSNNQGVNIAVALTVPLIFSEGTYIAAFVTGSAYYELSFQGWLE